MIDMDLSLEGGMEVSLQDDVFDVDLTVEQLDMDFSEAIIVQGERLPDYEGEYQITPRITEQILETKDKSMVDNVTIFQIPYAAVSNPSGGQTVTIGLE